MASPANNLLLRLHKWASRQDENFLTESLAVVLEQLLVLAPAVGTRLVAKLTGGFIDLPPEDASAIELHTQVETGEGRPDLEICSPHRLVVVEAKVEAEVRSGQLERYQDRLAKSGVTHGQLVVLSRYPAVVSCGIVNVRWFQVAEWLEEMTSGPGALQGVAGFLVREMLDLLGARSMTLAQVGKFMPEGTRALASLRDMLREVAEKCSSEVALSFGWDYIGLYLDGKKFWVGVYFSKPEEILFATEKRYCQIDRKKAEELKIGKVEPLAGVPGRPRWLHWVDMASEEIHFFARSKVSQMQWLEEFLRDCLKKARSIETPDQPPPPEDYDEGS
jgi:hypothetical protein